MRTVVCDLPLGEEGSGRLGSLPGVQVSFLEPHSKPWDIDPRDGRAAEVLLCRLPPRNLDAMPALKLIQIGTVGYEHLKEHNFPERPLIVCNARGVFDTAIGEWNVAMMIALVRDLPGMIRNQDQARWQREARFAQEVRGSVVGLWGYGGIGRETARLARTLGLTVHVLTRQGVKPREDTYVQAGTGDPEGKLPDRVFVAGQEQEFLTELDFLVLALPHTRASDGLVDEGVLRALKRTTFLLNPARGPIVREEALLRALREGWIAGAALDTHYSYPLPREHPLWGFPNVILTPHVSGSDRSPLFAARMADLCVQNLQRYLAGRSLFNVLRAEEWHES
jgi:phosphoglycerate dehydrogenase-like enzyme